MKIVYCGQFEDASGYGVAARGYLKALDNYLSNWPNDFLKKFELKVHPITFEGTNKNSLEDNDLIDKYRFNSNKEMEEFTSKPYLLIWHLPAPSLVVHQQRHTGRWPTTEKLIKGAKRLMNLAAWETDGVPMEWLKVYKDFNFSSITVPSKWNQKIFSKAIGERDCYLLPHIIEDPQKQATKTPILDEEKLKDKFVVFSMSQWNHRKGFDKLIQAFCMEFKKQDDVALVIKTYGHFVGNVSPDQEKEQNVQIGKQISNYKNSIHIGFGNIPSVPIYFVPGVLPFENISWLYEQTDLFALTTRGEGFGLTIAEALMHKKPVLVPKEGGHIDYISKDAAFWTKGYWQPHVGSLNFTCDMKWYEPDIMSVREQLRMAYDLWKHSPRNLSVMGSYGRTHINKNGYDSYSIGEKFYKILDKEFRKVDKPPKKVKISSKLSQVKKKTATLKSELAQLGSLQERVDLLKDSYKGEECVILNCGPSLSQYTKDELKEKLSDKLVLAVKQAYDYAPSIVDFHFWNCSNLPYGDNFIHYPYKTHRPIAVASSNYPEGVRWSPMQPLDLFFRIPIRTEINNEFLVKTKKFDEYLLEKNLTRPCAPGIMLETVIYTALHLGVSKITTLGWDLNKDAKKLSEHKHFYGETDGLLNRGDILPWEIKANRDISEDLYTWLKDRNVELNIATEGSSLSSKIPRIKL